MMSVNDSTFMLHLFDENVHEEIILQLWLRLL